MTAKPPSTPPETHSLEEVHGSVRTDYPKLFRRMFAFMGPAYMVSVGYMDPGNWATDIEGGARFGYTLIWVLLMSNLMAILLQTLSARLGIIGGKDLAQACRSEYPKPVAFFQWVLCEIAIAACDLAEVLGTILGLNLLFGLPLLWGCVITLFDTLLLLAIQRLGIRRMEAFILSLIFIIGVCFMVEIFLSKPEWGGIASGFVPSLPPGALYVALGMLGATVMPHNLYLHSALVQTRKVSRIVDSKAQAARYNLVDSAIALNAAFFVNAAILIVSAAVFFRNGVEVTEIQQAHGMLDHLLGSKVAPLAFGIALLAAGQSSTLTGTLAGQIVMEGFVNIRVRPWLRRLITRSIALIPAVIVISLTGDRGTYRLMILSQVILSLQLPFAIIPLIHFTSDKAKMGAFANKWAVKAAGWASAIIIISLNGKLVFDKISEWISGGAPEWLGVIVVVVAGVIALTLAYITIMPFFRGPRGWASRTVSGATAVIERIASRQTKHIAAALDRSPADAEVLSHAVALAKAQNARLTLLHVADSAQTQIYGSEAYSEHEQSDELYLDEIATELRGTGLPVEIMLLHGAPAQQLISFGESHGVDLLVMGSHGHRAISDIILGETVAPVRHGTQIPVLVVRQTG